jgi:FkbM family methyltransferase
LVEHAAPPLQWSIVVIAGQQITAFLKDTLRPIVSSLPQLSGLPSWPRSMSVLKHHGFRPVTVFDIGVGYGTFPLYRAFPDAFYHLIDPAHESLAYMRRLARRLRCEVHAVALGDHEGTAMLEVRADIQESTLLEEVGPRQVRRVDCVPVRRFDALFGPIARPSLCKIDVQGAELMVLAGMTGRLAEIDALIIETSTIATVKDGAEVDGTIRFLGEHGFALADIVGLRRRPLDGATAQLDLLFVPNKAPPRSDRRWASA